VNVQIGGVSVCRIAIAEGGLGVEVWYGGIGEDRGAHCRSLGYPGMTKGTGAVSEEIGLWMKGHSRSLHFATLRSG
jgi:hypothetical protein